MLDTLLALLAGTGEAAGQIDQYRQRKSLLARQEEEQQREAEERKLLLAERLSGLRSRGVVPIGEARPTDMNLPVFGAGPGVQSQRVSVPTDARFKPLGGTGMAVDTLNTPEAQQRVAQHQQQQATTKREAETFRAYVQAGMQPGQALAAIRNPGLADDFFKPKPQERAEPPRTLETAKGIMQWDAASGGWKPTGMQPYQAPREPKDPKAMVPTEGERRANALRMMVEDASPILDSASAPGYFDKLAAQAGGQHLVGEQQQVINQAAEQLVSSYLYLVSGAQAPPDEVKRQAMMIAPQTGDKPPLLQRKAAARAVMIKAVRSMSGRAAPAPTTDAPPIDGRGAPVNPWRQ